jgi:hypothetical protein
MCNLLAVRMHQYKHLCSGQMYHSARITSVCIEMEICHFMVWIQAVVLQRDFHLSSSLFRTHVSDPHIEIFALRSVTRHIWPLKLIFFFFKLCGGILGTAATTGLLYQLRVISEGHCGETGGMKIGLWSYSRCPFRYVEVLHVKSLKKKIKNFSRHLEITVFWNVMPCRLIESYRCFAGTSCLHFRVEKCPVQEN